MVHARKIQIHTGETTDILLINNLDLSTLKVKGEKTNIKKTDKKDTTLKHNTHTHTHTHTPHTHTHTHHPTHTHTRARTHARTRKTNFKIRDTRNTSYIKQAIRNPVEIAPLSLVFTQTIHACNY